MSKSKYHECKSLREFHKIIRKYGKYTLPVGYKYRKTKKRGMPTHKFRKEIKRYCWLSIEFKGLDALNSPEFIKESQKKVTYYDWKSKSLKTVDSNLKHIRQDAIAHYGEILTDKRDGSKWKFVGVEITNEDYYYIHESVDTEPVRYRYLTCVCGWDEI